MTVNNEGTYANSCAETVPSRPVRILCNEGAKDAFVIAGNTRAEADEILSRSRSVRTVKYFTVKGRL